MADSYPPINPKCPHFLHGGDYNPDQWSPEIWDEDMRLMREAHCNAMSVGIFSWVKVEPEAGRYEFDWLDEIMDRLADNDSWAVLATPTAAHPAWMSQKYPEILRTGVDRIRRRHRGRVNYCLSSPIYREKCRQIASKLAERYADHPALLVWHIHNEYGGACYCKSCEQTFRDWLQGKYESLDELNEKWWTAFWGHTYTDWSQIEAPGGPYGEGSIMGQTLDWKRFVTDQMASLIRNEAEVLREHTPEVPITTNFMGTYPGLNYWRLAEEIDVISWDAYPKYHDRPSDRRTAVEFSFRHDINRCMKGGRPFMLMESTPSSTNWMPVMKLKRPGVHRLSSLQAVAHGADTVQYFQWRKSRGGAEKFHGAVVDHAGHENTRVFREVAEVGSILEQLDPVIGTSVRPEVGLIYDWENRWAIEGAAGPRKEVNYEGICHDHYRPFWERSIPVDVIEMDCSFESYRLLVAPMLYMIRPGVSERLEDFVRQGGTLVITYWSGIVDENDRCFLGGWPGPLRELAGIWSEEMDVLYDDESNRVEMEEGNSLGLQGSYGTRIFCDLVREEDAEVLARYAEDFYAGRPALTVNQFGEGQVYYVAFQDDGEFLDDFYGSLSEELRLKRTLETELPEGVTAQVRRDGEGEFVFLLNFNDESVNIPLGDDKFGDLLTGREVEDLVSIPAYGSLVLERIPTE